MMKSQNSKDFIEMGLGKTLQAISLLSYLKVYLKTPGPFLVLCPLSVTDGWMSEMANFAPKLRVLSYTGDKEHRCNLRRKIYESMNREASVAKSLPFDVLLTTYDIVLLDEDFLSQVPWCYAIIDEAQRLKNPSSVLYNVLKERFVMPRKLLMTGTPIQNNLSELWALLHFCMPSVFGTVEQFLSAFKEAGDPSCPDADKAKEQFKILKYVIGAFMLRRTKSQLIELGTLVLPPLTEITVMAPLVALQKKVYMSILRKELSQLLALASGAPNTRSLQNIVIQLRKACSHPYLFAGIEPEPYEEGEHLVQASGKLLILDHLLQKLHACGHRVLLFSQMTQTLDILQDYLELRKYSYERLDGSIRAEERFAAIRSFSHNRSKFEAEQNAAFVFLISTRAGGVGLNLVAADTVIMRRAQRKLQLSHNIVGDDVLDQEGKEMAGAEAGDLRSVMLGLHMLDPAEVTNEESDKFDRNELTAMAETIMAFRNKERSARDDKFEVKPANFLSEFNVVTKRGPESVKLDQILDETSYLEWVEKFKEASQINHNPIFELGNRRSLPEEKHLKAEAAKKKVEEEKMSKWETLGYHSLSVKDPVSAPDTDISSDSGAVHFVYGDCTRPSKVSSSEPTIIFSCVDTSGNWGHGGMFDALARLSTSVPAAYERASEFGDLHLGDLHLIEITEDLAKGSGSPHASQWVALAVVQSYNPRRKVPRGSISIPDLERCLSKASYSAAQKSASIHMPRIGYQDGSDRSEWYTIERLLRKYAALHGINIFVYYFRRASQS
ncbi:probable helicase CHR10 isoform X2 [Solanum lycopersicum]|uniref:probable helicase CHR10 isoform X2 n=1 Tax=Solanum lycopersicum TaxID=4081 RepID=UPI0037487B72